MSISKIVFKESANATPVTWMDATIATAAAADITAPKTAMLADGVVTTGTGSAGGGGYTGEEMVTRQLTNTDLDIGTAAISINYAFSESNITSLTSYGTRLVASGKNATEAFANCADLETLNFPNMTIMGGQRIFSGCTALETLVFPKCGALEGASMFQNCTKLKCVDLGSPTVTAARLINAQSVFNNDSAFDTLILRQTSVGALYNVNAFSGTPFASGGSGGTLYVWQSLLTEYEQASNWSTILGYANNQIKSIESTHTDPNAPIDLTLYYADGTLIPT